MATVPLPPIGGEDCVRRSNSFTHRNIHSSAKLAPMARRTVRKSRAFDKTFMKMSNLRKQLPTLTQQETDRITCSFINNLCLDMLREGLHEAFAEIFNIIKKQHQVREEAGPESTLWTKKLLDDQPQKLTVMKQWLVRAEQATLEDDYVTVYQCHHELAKYFQTTSPDDKWISDHFFDLALQVSDKLPDGGRLIAEANCNTGLALKEAGDLRKACEHFEKFHALCRGHDWRKHSGESLYTESCRQLSLIYSGIGEEHYSPCYSTRRRATPDSTTTPASTTAFVGEVDVGEVDVDFDATSSRDEYAGADALVDPEPNLFHEYLMKSYDKAVEAADIDLIGVSSYKLGLAYERVDQSETAIKYLNIYKDACLSTKDMDGLGTAYAALARSLQWFKSRSLLTGYKNPPSIGKEDDSIRHLELYAKVSEDSKNDHALSQACSNLGQVFNTLGEYEQAVDHFNKSYNISRAISDDLSISLSRVFYGIATAHKMNDLYLGHLTEVQTIKDESSKQMMCCLMDWKDCRAEEIIKGETEPTPKYQQDAVSISMAKSSTKELENQEEWSDEN